jgi:hypothetical protein
MNVGESQTLKATSGSSKQFSLRGGVYVLTAVCATWSSANVSLAIEGPDNATYTSVSTLSANGMNTPLYLPAGSYELQISGTAGATIYAAVASVQF